MAQDESKVNRLIRNKSAKMIDEIDTATYKEAGVVYVNWVIEPGACSKCISLKDSGPYQIDKAPALVIDSHPNCRCAKVPVEDGGSIRLVLTKVGEKNEAEATGDDQSNPLRTNGSVDWKSINSENTEKKFENWVCLKKSQKALQKKPEEY